MQLVGKQNKEKRRPNRATEVSTIISDQSHLNCSRLSENNVGNQLDALLESDSDEDYLVVDDQTENCEITTSSKPEDADVEPPLNKNPPQTAENNSPQNNNPGTIMNTSSGTLHWA